MNQKLVSNPDPVLDEQRASDYLQVSSACLRRWRRLRAGPDWIRCGRLVRYRQSALERFLSENKQGSAARVKAR